MTQFVLSGNTTIDALANPAFKWGSGGAGVAATVTYSFPQAGATWIGDYYDGEPFSGFQGFNASQREAARDALDLWQDVANITFEEVPDTASDVGDIRFGFSSVVSNDPFAIAWGYFPYSDPDFEFPEAGDIWFDPTYAPNLQMAPGQFGFSTLIHEIGHAIGLDHPFDDGFGEPTLPASMDNNQYTIMAYDLHPTASVEAMTPMLLDILAIQYIYGANMTTRTGDDTYTFSSSAEQLRAIWDAGGTDTFDAGNQTLAVSINLNDGEFSSIGRRNAGGSASNNIAIAYGAVIENARGGSGNDKLTGNEFDNLLDGNLGNDTLRGGAGNDTYVVDSTGDLIDEQGSGSKADWVRAMVTVNLATLGAGAVENAVAYTGANINLTGNGGANLLYGGAGKNTIDGGAGNDTLWAGAGVDTLIGGLGDDYLDGVEGNDILRGGAGNDIYVIDSLADVIDEQGNTSTDDLVLATFSLNISTLAGGALDHAQLRGATNANVTGNSRANRLLGNGGINTIDAGNGDDIIYAGLGNDTVLAGAGRDWLDGAGGNDVLKGGSGNDYYIVDSLGDVVDEENNNDAADEVRATISIDLATYANGKIERSVLMGTGAIDSWGTEAGNTILGNDKANLLDGRGGRDFLLGLGGDDTLIGAQGDDWLDGGTGTNTAVFAGMSDDYSVVIQDGTITVTDLAPTTDGNDGTDTLANFRHLEFADKTITLNLTPNAVSITALLDDSDTDDSLDTGPADDASGRFPVDAGTGDSGRIAHVANGHVNAMTLNIADLLVGDAAPDNAQRIEGGMGDTPPLFSADGGAAADTLSLAGCAIYSSQAAKVAIDTIDLTVT